MSCLCAKLSVRCKTLDAARVHAPFGVEPSLRTAHLRRRIRADEATLRFELRVNKLLEQVVCLEDGQHLATGMTGLRRLEGVDVRFVEDISPVSLPIGISTPLARRRVETHRLFLLKQLGEASAAIAESVQIELKARMEGHNDIGALDDLRRTRQVRVA